ncbi:hypothetical protein GGS21DRAFT_489569 [Xylaria nigripes]|nr:hypothetical protein GGS21DRAFT_489569 [Xylaria nigripes]
MNCPMNFSHFFIGAVIGFFFTMALFMLVFTIEHCRKRRSEREQKAAEEQRAAEEERAAEERAAFDQLLNSVPHLPALHFDGYPMSLKDRPQAPTKSGFPMKSRFTEHL